MPVTVKKRNGKYRLVDITTGKLTKTKAGTSADGGGHKSQAAAKKQMAAINISQARKRGRKIPRKK